MILNNFFPLNIVGDHLILIRNNNADFLRSPLLTKIQQYKDDLLNVYLYMIPYSEGLYKYQQLAKGNLLIKSNGQVDLQKQLSLKQISSKNKVIALTPSIGLKNGTLNYLKIISADGIESTIYFNSCKRGKPCIINLANIPLFYKERIISNIQLDKIFKGELKIIELKDFGNLW